MLLFFAGCFVGAGVGIMLIAIVSANRDDDNISMGHPLY